MRCTRSETLVSAIKGIFERPRPCSPACGSPHFHGPFLEHLEESALVDGSCLVGAIRCPYDLAHRPGWTADRARNRPKLIYSEAPGA